MLDTAVLACYAGGWLQVAAKTMPVGSLIMGVDLVPIKPIRGVKTLVQDITTQQCRTAIKREAGGAKMDVVLHDGAPNVGGAWASEAYNQVDMENVGRAQIPSRHGMWRSKPFLRPSPDNIAAESAVPTETASHPH